MHESAIFSIVNESEEMYWKSHKLIEWEFFIQNSEIKKLFDVSGKNCPHQLVGPLLGGFGLQVRVQKKSDVFHRLQEKKKLNDLVSQLQE
jgi:N-acetylmuramoyl-L-alanine amidase CwlA